MNVHELAHASWLAYVDPANRGSVDTMEVGKMAEKKYEGQNEVEGALVEKAARALCEFDGHDPDVTFLDGDPRWQPWVDRARAALLAVLPDSAPAPEGEYEELCKRLERASEYEPLGHDGWEAATALRTVLRERDEARAQLLVAVQHRDALRDDLAEATAALLAAEKAMDDSGLRGTPAHDAILATLSRMEDSNAQRDR